MNLNSIIKDGSAVIAMDPEDLALAVLRSLNASDENYARRGQRENIGFTNYCRVCQKDNRLKIKSTPEVRSTRS